MRRKFHDHVVLSPGASLNEHQSLRKVFSMNEKQPLGIKFTKSWCTALPSPIPVDLCPSVPICAGLSQDPALWTPDTPPGPTFANFLPRLQADKWKKV